MMKFCRAISIGISIACLLGLPRVYADDLSPTNQQQLAKRLGDKVQRFKAWTDVDGNVIGLLFINHQSLNQSVGARPGINDDDLQLLVSFPKLTALVIEAQPVTDAGLAVIQRFPSMKQVGFHYMAKAPGSKVSADFIEVINGLNDLEIIEIKHNFKVDAINVEQLETTYPKVWSLVLDTPLTADQMMHMIRLCPNVRDLQLHRTNISPAQLEEIGRLLPHLEVLWFKPNGNLSSQHLQSLQTFSQLRIFSPQHFKNTIPFAGGWDVLATLPNLERLEIDGPEAVNNAEMIKMLIEESPKLVVESNLTRSRNYNGI